MKEYVRKKLCRANSSSYEIDGPKGMINSKEDDRKRIYIATKNI